MDVAAQLTEEVSRLRELVASTEDPRLSILLAATSDESVQALLAERAGEGHDYGGALITNRGGRAEVVFTFSRAAGAFGVLPLSILVRVNSEGTVAELVDGYLPPPPPDPTKLQAGLQIDVATFEAEGFGDEAAATEDGGDFDKRPKVAPPPKGDVWV